MMRGRGGATFSSDNMCLYYFHQPPGDNRPSSLCIAHHTTHTHTPIGVRYTVTRIVSSASVPHRVCPPRPLTFTTPVLQSATPPPPVLTPSRWLTSDDTDADSDASSGVSSLCIQTPPHPEPIQRYGGHLGDGCGYCWCVARSDKHVRCHRRKPAISTGPLRHRSADHSHDGTPMVAPLYVRAVVSHSRCRCPCLSIPLPHQQPESRKYFVAKRTTQTMGAPTLRMHSSKC